MGILGEPLGVNTPPARRSDVDGRVRDYHLPDVVVARAKEIARRTRLSRVERADVAVELCEEAALAIGNGESTEEALEGMGEPQAVARFIRRERIRRRPLVIRLIRGWLRRVTLTVLALLLVYLYFFVRFCIGTPRISRNIAAEINAKLPAAPEEATGLFALRRGMSMAQVVPEDIAKRWPYFKPGDAEWEQAKKYVEASSGVLEWIRKSAAAPSFGYRLSDAYDPSLSSDPETRKEKAKAGHENPLLLDTLMAHLGAIRWSVRLLAADARVACELGDGKRAESDIEAIIGLAGHVREIPTLISDLVSVAAMSVAADEVGGIVAEHQGLLGDAQLVNLSRRFEGFAGGPIPLRLEGERGYFEDWVQRSYTDDGKGDGRICLKGVSNMWSQLSMNGGGNSPGVGVYLIGPLASQFLATRKEVVNEWQRIEGLVLQERAVPRWMRGEPAYDAEIDRMRADPRRSIKFAPLFVFAPAWGRASDAVDNGSMRRDGAVTVIALERWRLVHGSYPEHLEQLVPEFLAAVPVDSFDGAPLRYKSGAGLPILYSIGGDADDDDGRVPEPGGSKANANAAAWRSPSTRWKCPDGDFVIWPPVQDKVEAPEP